MRRLIEYVPSWAGETLELQVFFRAVEAELTRAAAAADALFWGQFPETAEGKELTRWETMLGLSHLGSIAARRARIVLHLRRTPPYTLERLRAAIAAETGESGAALRTDGYTLVAQIGSEDALSAVCDLLSVCAPAVFRLDVTKKLACHNELSACTHAALSAYTHEELRNEVATHAD